MLFHHLPIVEILVVLQLEHLDVAGVGLELAKLLGFNTYTI